MTQRTRIKICGVRDAETARVAVAAGADCVGVVFVPASPRYVDAEQAKAIAQAVRPAAKLVGVFKDEPIERIVELAASVPLDEVQLHGDCDETRIARLAPTPVVRAVSFEPDTFAAQLARCSAAATTHANLHAILVDTPDPSRLGGGTGETFDWSALRSVLDTAESCESRLPIILAGGLNAANVAEAIAAVTPYGVDVSSGVESARGIKDHERILAFCGAVSPSQGA